jgi:hypothetical protein
MSGILYILWVCDAADLLNATRLWGNPYVFWIVFNWFLGKVRFIKIQTNKLVDTDG